MIDGIIKADGTSRLMRAELPATYEEFRAQCRAGTQSLDVLFNALGWSQLPTFLNKANLLKDTTAALFGLSSDAVPDDALRLLSRFQNGLGNEYVWAKTKEATSYTCTETVDKEPSVIYVASYAAAPQTYYYADEFEYAEDGRTFVLKNPQSFSNAKNDYANANMYSVLKGKYVIMSMAESTSMFFYPQDCNIYNKTVDGYNSVVTSERHNFYNPKKEIAVESFGYVNSPDLSAYPLDDGYTYTALGQLGEKVRMVTGSYTGTGTYGASNPNSLTFGFAPKIVFISAYYSDRQHFFIAVNENSSAQYIESYKSGSVDGGISAITSFTKVLSWYSEQHAMGQMNASGATYNYIAIG